LVVTVHLHTTLQRQTPTGPLRRLDVTVPTGATLADLVAQLEIQLHEESILLVVNGRQAELARPLREGDEIHLIPALSGGAPDGLGAAHPASTRASLA
jgi:molybdopterin converting factor small subunit